MEDENDILDLYRLPGPDDGLDEIIEDVLRMPEHRHLVENSVDLAFLFRMQEKIVAERHVLGTVFEPRVQGGLRDVFEWLLGLLLGRVPRFLVVLDGEYWAGSNKRLKTILVFHELCHVKQKTDKYGDPRFDADGMPVYGLRAHDVEEFTAVVARYGAWNEEIAGFVEAAGAGHG